MKGYFVLAAILIVVALAGGLFLAPRFGTKLEGQGTRVTGQVQAKNSVPGPDGITYYQVSVVYQDENRVNRRATVALKDGGQYEELEVGKDVAVWYLPDNPDKASIAGGAGMISPVSGMIRFVSWTLAGIAAFLIILGLKSAAQAE